jgi:hypothetical protein
MGFLKSSANFLVMLKYLYERGLQRKEWELWSLEILTSI